MTARTTSLLLFATSAVVCFAADWLSKRFVFAWLGVDSMEPFVLIPGWLQFNTAINQGGIWSFGAGWGATMNFWLSCFAGFAAVVIMAWACLTIRPGQRVFPLVLGAILGGALGNLHDRFVYEGVRDFIQFHYQHIWYFPTFNVADSCLVCGAIYLILASMFAGDDPVPAEAARKSPVPSSTGRGIR